MPGINFDCPKCNQSLNAAEEFARELIECPFCKETIEVPIRSQQAESPKPSPVSVPVSTDTPASPSSPKYRPIEGSGVADALFIIGVLELIAAPIAGFLTDQKNTSLGWIIFLSGLVSGLILLGLARVVEHLNESAQRLRHIEFLLRRGVDDKNAD